MIKIFTFGIITFLVTSSYAQRMDYDHSSKWFFGLNTGATWQTTDVTNQTNAGYGFTLGRSFNYTYGKLLSADIRGRFLTGYWYGQDLTLSSLQGYNPNNEPGFPLMDYVASGIVHNYQSEVKELSLELVLHANKLREHTAWDPYIFGGIGKTYFQTFGDLKEDGNLGGGNAYAFDPNQIGVEEMATKDYLARLMDGIYETPLTGSFAYKFSEATMPSLGIGLGYQVGERFTLGVEHKTTFTRRDDFDGLILSSTYKDMYHYTSAYLQFRFKKRTAAEKEAARCDEPKIKINSGHYSGQEIYQDEIALKATIKEVNQAKGITLIVNQLDQKQFQYDSTRSVMSQSIPLIMGKNNVRIIAVNGCGADTLDLVLIRKPCISPMLTLIEPLTLNNTYTEAQTTLKLQTSHIRQRGQITIKQNGSNLTSFTWSKSDSILVIPVILVEGQNNVLVSVKSECGEATQNYSLTFKPCYKPVFTALKPTTSSTTVYDPEVEISGIIKHVSDYSKFQVTRNGLKLSTVLVNQSTGAFQSKNRLPIGENIFVLRAENQCGITTDTLIITVKECVKPTVKFTTIKTGMKVIQPAFTIGFGLTNFNGSIEDITLNLNGIKQPIQLAGLNGSSAVTLSPGTNTIDISIKTACTTTNLSTTLIYVVPSTDPPKEEQGGELTPQPILEPTEQRGGKKPN